MQAPEWLASIGRQRPDLYHAIYDFNLRPQFWVHPVRLEVLPDWKRLMALPPSTTTSLAIGKFVAEALGIPSQTEWDFQPIRRRVALLPADSLRQLAHFTGATLLWKRLTSIISGRELQEIHRQIGQTAHAFAVRRGRALFPNPTTGSAPPHDSPREAGWNALSALFSNDHHGFQQRFSLRLPPDLEPGSPQNLDPNELESLLLRIAKESLPSHPLQCYF